MADQPEPGRVRWLRFGPSSLKTGLALGKAGEFAAQRRHRRLQGSSVGDECGVPVAKAALEPAGVVYAMSTASARLVPSTDPVIAIAAVAVTS